MAGRSNKSRRGTQALGVGSEAYRAAEASAITEEEGLCLQLRHDRSAEIDVAMWAISRA